MKKRILAIALTLVLLLGTFAAPASAATAKDAYNFLKELALEGYYNEIDDCWHTYIQIGSNNIGSYYFFITYMVKTKYVHTAIVFFSDNSNYLSYEVGWKISSNPSPSYNAYIEIYDTSSTPTDTIGTVVLPANYSGGAYTAFKTFTGNTQMKSAMLDVLNTFLPGVLEYTRFIINLEDYSLATLGMTGYKKCDWIHAYDEGKVTKEPTCGTIGVRTYTCRVCKDKYSEAIAPTGNHIWDNGKVLDKPTCTTPGLKRYTCTVCKNTKDETIPVKGHSWDSGVITQEPTCLEFGWITYTCNVCGYGRSQTLSALGHAWEYTETLIPTEGSEHGRALYTCSRCGETKEDTLCAGLFFTDMPKEGNWAHDPIDWAFFNGITSGKTATTFVPKGNCSRGEVVTFLWRAAGCPAPTITECPFTDVKEGAYYYTAMLWAVENGITAGKTETTFAPKATCTRAEVVTFLWRAAGCPEPWAENPEDPTSPEAPTIPEEPTNPEAPTIPEDPTNPEAPTIPEDPEDPTNPEAPTIPEDPTNPEAPTIPEEPEDPTNPEAPTIPEDPAEPEPDPEPVLPENPFTDVKESAYYYKALLWAIDAGVTNGTSPTTFSPRNVCTRAQVVTFLYNAVAK